MRLEQVLAQWARGIAIPGGAQEPAATSVAGRWTNDYGSVAEIGVDGNRVFGTYTSSVGADKGLLSGPINGFVQGDIVAFAVLWPASMRSITSWVDQLVEVNGTPELKTLWHLIVDIPDSDESTGLWTTVHTGADTFR